jgi:hypothetical protein
MIEVGKGKVSVLGGKESSDSRLEVDKIPLLSCVLTT